MAKSTKTSEPAKQNRTKKRGIQFYTSDELADAFEAFINSFPEDRRPKKGPVLETALKEYLQREGHWPLKQ